MANEPDEHEAQRKAALDKALRAQGLAPIDLDRTERRIGNTQRSDFEEAQRLAQGEALYKASQGLSTGDNLLDAASTALEMRAAQRPDNGPVKDHIASRLPASDYTDKYPIEYGPAPPAKGSGREAPNAPSPMDMNTNKDPNEREAKAHQEIGERYTQKHATLTGKQEQEFSRLSMDQYAQIKGSGEQTEAMRQRFTTEHLEMRERHKQEHAQLDKHEAQEKKAASEKIRSEEQGKQQQGEKGSWTDREIAPHFNDKAKPGQDQGGTERKGGTEEKGRPSPDNKPPGPRSETETKQAKGDLPQAQAAEKGAGEKTGQLPPPREGQPAQKGELPNAPTQQQAPAAKTEPMPQRSEPAKTPTPSAPAPSNTQGNNPDRR